MKKEELNKIIETLESSHSMDDAYVAIYQYGDDPDESYAKANKEGLALLAIQLLKGSRDFDEIVANDEESVIPIDYNEEWIDGDVFIKYVKPVDKKGKLIREEEASHEGTFLDKLLPFGCIGVIILIVISTIIGLISIFNWIF